MKKFTRAQKFEILSVFVDSYQEEFDDFCDTEDDISCEDIMQFLDKEKEKAERKSKSKSKETGDVKVDFCVYKKKTTYINSNELGIDINFLHKCLEDPEVYEIDMDNIAGIICYLNEKCIKKNEKILNIEGLYLKEHNDD